VPLCAVEGQSKLLSGDVRVGILLPAMTVRCRVWQNDRVVSSPLHDGPSGTSRQYVAVYRPSERDAARLSPVARVMVVGSG
jgi:hypothetical protein